jgi:glycosyltransferase involved in cell wall biosynthesis
VAEPRLLIATTVPSTSRGFLLPYADHFRQRGWTVDALTGPGDALVDLSGHFDDVHVVPWSRRPADRRNVSAALPTVRRLLARGRYDLLHTHTPVASTISRAAVVGLRRKPAVVYTAHGFHFHAGGSRVANLGYAAVERVMGRWTDRLVVINDEDYAAARRMLDPDRVVLMAGIGLDLERYRPDSASADDIARIRSELGLAPADVLMSVVAELNPGKNHDTVLRALARNGDPDIHLALAGAGPERQRLEELAAGLGVSDRVHWLGVVADVRPLVLASASTILLSRREGLSRAVMESLAMGVPVIGSRIRGIADLVGRHGGLLVAPDDVDGAAAALDAVQDLPRAWQLRTALAERLASLSLVRLLHQHDDLYADLLVRRH